MCWVLRFNPSSRGLAFGMPYRRLPDYGCLRFNPSSRGLAFGIRHRPNPHPTPPPVSILLLVD